MCQSQEICANIVNDTSDTQFVTGKRICVFFNIDEWNGKSLFDRKYVVV